MEDTATARQFALSAGPVSYFSRKPRENPSIAARRNFNALFPRINGPVIGRRRAPQ